ncbi:MBG domain-containing protein, partial [Secundilactobacillus oryzae]
ADGVYSVSLSAAGQAKVEAANPNYTFTADSFLPGQFIIEVNDATASQINQVHTNNKTVNQGDSTPDFTVTYGSNLNTVNLTIVDFIFTTMKNGKVVVFNGVAPTEPGEYSVNLNAIGQAKVKVANPHMVFSASAFLPGRFTILSQYTVNPGTPVISIMVLSLQLLKNQRYQKHQVLQDQFKNQATNQVLLTSQNQDPMNQHGIVLSQDNPMMEHQW